MSNLASAFAGIKQAQEPESDPAPTPAKTTPKPKPQAAKAATVAAPKPTTGKGLPIPKSVAGKSSHEDYGSLKVYVRKETRRKAERKWEDEGGGDLSDLVEHLLSRYAGS